MQKPVFPKISAISKLLFAVAIVVVMLHFAFHPVRVLNMQTSIFYLDEELTLAGLFTSAFAFYVCMLALELFLKTRDKINLIWSAIFLALCLDEYFSIHEYLNGLLKTNFDSESVFAGLASVSWVLTLGLILLVVIAFIMWRILQESSLGARTLLLIGIACYVTVLALEVFGGQTYGEDIYLVFIAFEEGLELVGTVFFIEAFRQKLSLGG